MKLSKLLSELDIKTYASAYNIARGRGDGKGSRVASLAIDQIGKLLTKQYKGQSFIVANSNRQSKRLDWHSDTGGRKTNPRVTFTINKVIADHGGGVTMKGKLHIPKNNTIGFVDTDGSVMVQYNGYMKVGYIWTGRGGVFYPQEANWMMDRKGARIFSKIADQLNKLMGDGSGFKANKIKQL